MFIDSHCHLTSLEDIDAIFFAASAAEVIHMINIGCDHASWNTSLNLANSYNNVSTTLGIHPCECKEMNTYEWSEVELFIIKNKDSLVGLGEVGLDYYWTDAGDIIERKWQAEMFKRHSELSHVLKLPLVIHTRNAEEDTLKLLEKYPPFITIMHCFAGSEEFYTSLQQIKNIYFSFSGIVTFKNAKTLHAIAKIIPVEQILIETDSPYLAPTPFRGKINQPAFVQHTFNYLSSLRTEPSDILKQHIVDNTLRAFENLRIL